MMINHISEVMGRKRMRISDLARQAEISRVTAQRLYNGNTDITLPVLDKVCRALDTGLCELIEYVPDEQAQQDHKNKNELTATGAKE